ncbi:MAG TPA: hypothetical protein VJ739_07950 [Gemmataceae bacterium]|nr:hypothetical protein [Gemmataceae bacterium]
MAGRVRCLVLVALACLAAGRAPAGESAPAAVPDSPVPDWFRPNLPGLDSGRGQPEWPGPPAAEARPWLPLLAVPLRPGDLVTADGNGSWLDPQGDFTALKSLRKQTEGPLGSFTAQVDWAEPHALRDESVLGSPWHTEEAWRLPVLGPLFLFGQFAANPDPVTTDALKVNGRTGVGCKIPVLLGIEVLLRGGPSVSYADPLGPDRGERSELLLEFQCHCPLPGQLGLEYQTTAVPALSPLEHDHITQDLGLALPLGDVGKLRLGAKHQWENVQTTRPWVDNMQLYVGFELLQQARKQ